MSEPPEPPRRPQGPQLRAGRSVVFAIILSLLIPGLGHLYAGRYGRALIWFVGALAIGLILNQEATISSASLALVTGLGVLAAGDCWWLMKSDPVERS
jgi:hypothetical protein